VAENWPYQPAIVADLIVNRERGRDRYSAKRSRAGMTPQDTVDWQGVSRRILRDGDRRTPLKLKMYRREPTLISRVG